MSSLAAFSDDPDRSLTVRNEREGAGNEGQWLASSVGRELQFLLGHMVHHHAIIALLLSQQGIELPEGFGGILDQIGEDPHEKCD